jgi:glucosamine--fructose-6-phosphate aminotransferase (isomerizing)
MTAMMEDMLQQPAALEAVRSHYSKPDAIPEKKLKELVSKWPPAVVFTGMTSSLYTAYPAQVFLASRGIRAVAWETSELLHYYLKFLGRDTLLVVISQSGETVEIRKLLDALPKKTGLVGVVNAEASTLARRSKLTLPLKAGTQTTVSTKTYNSSVATLVYLAFAIAGKSPADLDRPLNQAIKIQANILQQRDTILSPLLDAINQSDSMLVLSRGPDLSTAYMGALYFKEVARIPAEPMSAGLFRHGPLETIHPDRRYIIIARRWKTGGLLVRLAKFIGAHGGRVLLLSDTSCTSDGVRSIKLQPASLGLGTLTDTLYFQLLTHELALRGGREPGKFWIHGPVVRVE